MIRKATAADVSAVSAIYEHIHEKEQAGDLCIGWLPGVYPVCATAQAAIQRGDLYVYEADGQILAAAIINQVQVDSYYGANWALDAEDHEVMVLHTLVVDPSAGKHGIGTEFVSYYEDFARHNKCSVLRMDTNAKNAVARAFYHKLGYREADVVPCEFNGIPNVMLVLLEKPL